MSATLPAEDHTIHHLPDQQTHVNVTDDEAEARVVQRNGREYLVFPIIACREMVLDYPEYGSRELLAKEKLQESVDLWAGTPITFIHPRNPKKTADLPEEYTETIIGQAYSPQLVDGCKIRVQAWVDVNKAIDLGGLASDVVEKLKDGQDISVSAGYATIDDDPAGGVFDGKEYDIEQGHLIPDHIAVFPSDEFQARCTWEDGCGAPRTNAHAQHTMPVGECSDGPCTCGWHANALDQARDPTYDGLVSAEWEPPSFTEYVQEYYDRQDADAPDDISVDTISSEAKQFAAERTLVGDADGESAGEVRSYPVVNLDDELNEDALTSARQLAYHSDAEESIKRKAADLLESKDWPSGEDYSFDNASENYHAMKDRPMPGADDKTVENIASPNGDIRYLRAGEYVEWDTDDGTGHGQVKAVATSGCVNILHEQKCAKGDIDRVVNIAVYEDGKPTGQRTLKKAYDGEPNESNLRAWDAPRSSREAELRNFPDTRTPVHNASDDLKVEIGDRTVDISPPEAVVNAADAALEAKDEYSEDIGDCGTGRGEQRANQLVDGDLAPEDFLTRDNGTPIPTYLDSHEEDVSGDEPPTDWGKEKWTDGCGPVQYALWGGVSTGTGLNWAEGVKDDLEAAIKAAEDFTLNARIVTMSEQIDLHELSLRHNVAPYLASVWDAEPGLAEAFTNALDPDEPGDSQAFAATVATNYGVDAVEVQTALAEAEERDTATVGLNYEPPTVEVDSDEGPDVGRLNARDHITPYLADKWEVDTTTATAVINALDESHADDLNTLFEVYPGEYETSVEQVTNSLGTTESEDEQDDADEPEVSQNALDNLVNAIGNALSTGDNTTESESDDAIGGGDPAEESVETNTETTNASDGDSEDEDEEDEDDEEDSDGEMPEEFEEQQYGNAEGMDNAVVAQIPFTENTQLLYPTQEQAKQVANMLGMEGSHPHPFGEDGEEMFMPGDSHEEYMNAIRSMAEESRANAEDLSKGDTVQWDWGDGVGYGEIKEIVNDGTRSVEGNERSTEPDDGMMIAVIDQMNQDGESEDQEVIKYIYTDKENENNLRSWDPDTTKENTQSMSDELTTNIDTIATNSAFGAATLQEWDTEKLVALEKTLLSQNPAIGDDEADTTANMSGGKGDMDEDEMEDDEDEEDEDDEDGDMNENAITNAIEDVKNELQTEIQEVRAMAEDAVNEKANAEKEQKAKVIANNVEGMTKEAALQLGEDEFERLANAHSNNVNFGAVPGGVDRNDVVTNSQDEDFEDYPAGGRSNYEERKQSGD